MTSPAIPTAGAPEVTGLGTAQAYACGMAAAYAAAVPRAEAFAASLTGHGVTVTTEAVAAAGRAKEATFAASQAWAAARRALHSQGQVTEAYALTPDAGDKHFVTDAAADPAKPADPAGRPAPPPIRQGDKATAPADSASPTGEPDEVRADRRAKAEIVAPFAELDWAASNIAAQAEDDDADPAELLDQLLNAVRRAAAAVGLGTVAESGEQEAYDPSRHDLLGATPASLTTVQVRDPGQTWRHAGRDWVIRPASVVPIDEERGAHLLTTAAGLDEEGGEAIWLDTNEAGLECWAGPGWYTVESVSDCEADDPDCPNRAAGRCDGSWVHLYYDDDGQAQGVHHTSDAPVVLDCNE